MKNIFLLCLCLLFVILSNAQILKLSLNESIALAADSSLQTFKSRNIYLSGYWQYRSYKAARLPSLTLRMTPIRYNRDFTKRYDSESNADLFRQQQSLYSYGNLSLSQNWDLTGGTFFLDSELGYMQNFETRAFPQYTTVPVRIGYHQSLFGFNSFRWEKKIEPLRYEIAKKQFLNSLEAISESTIQYFFSLAMAQAEYDMATDNVAVADTLYHIGKERYNIASISQADLLTLKLDAINAQNSFKNAEISLKRAMSEFVSFLNIDKGTQIALELPDKPHNIQISAELALCHARENNPDFQQNKQTILEAQRELARNKKSSAFDATFSVSVGFNQTATNFSDSYQNLLQQDVVSVGLTIPLVDWGLRKGKLNMAKNNLDISRISVRQKEQNLEQDIIMTVSDFNIQQDIIGSAEEALGLAIMAYNNNKQRFIIGKADISSLTLSLNRQKEAQKNYVASLKNYWQSYYKIRRLTLFDFEKTLPITALFDDEMSPQR